MNCQLAGSQGLRERIKEDVNNTDVDFNICVRLIVYNHAGFKQNANVVDYERGTI